jgi:hypothetical protein
MNTNKLLKIFCLTFVIIIPFVSSGQINHLYYGSNNISQKNLFNPALTNDSAKWVIGITGLGGTSAAWSTNFSLADVGTLNGNTLNVDLENFYAKAPDMLTFNQLVEIPLISIQFNKDRQSFSFSYIEKQYSSFAFDKELINLIDKGNGAYLGENVFKTALNLDFGIYHEFAFGYSRKITNALQIGGRLKIYSGIAAINTSNVELSFETAEDASYMKFFMDGDFNLAVPVNIEEENGVINDITIEEKFNLKSMILDFSNTGIGIDLGINYQLNDNIEVMASLLDLGSINWKTDVTNLYQTNEYYWEGVDFTNSIDKEDENYIPFDEQFETISDSLISKFKYKNERFKTNMPLKIAVGGKYSINNNFSLSIFDYLVLKEKPFNSISLAANVKIGHSFDLTGSYSIVGNSYSNVGLLGILTLKPVEIFIGCDNVPGIFSTPENVQFGFGINLLFN